MIQFNAKVKKLIVLQRPEEHAYAIEIADGAGETHLYEALKFALNELEKEGKRRKAIVVLTDGLDTQMRNSDRASLAKAQTDRGSNSGNRSESERVAQCGADCR